MTPQALKASILQLAIQGKLVPQRPEEGTAEELYQQIQAEKQRLIANGTIKREKALPPIKEDEIPFDIPETWKWVRLGELCTRFSTGPFGSNLHKEDYTSEGTPVVNPTNIQGNRISTTKIQRVGKATLTRLSSYMIQQNDIILARRGDLSKCAIVSETEEGWLCGTGAFFLNTLGINCTFFIYLYTSTYTQSYLLRDSVGTTMHNLNQTLLNRLPLPLPPMEEQKRIVAKIEELLPLIDRYGEAYTALESFNKRFPDDLRKSILQEAIQGKLVPQRPEEGNAEELYQQIQAEKQRLIAAGTIKKEKPLPLIEQKDIPFDLPETWKWVRLGDCGAFTRGSGIKKNEVVAEGKPCVRYGQLYTTYKTRFSQAVSHVPQELFDKCKHASKGDILMALTGENKVDIAMAVLYEGEEALAIGGDMTKFSPVRIDPLYLVYTLNSPYGISCKTERSTGDIIVHTSNDKLSTIPIPLPPLAEQQRIVAKIEELLTLCKSMQ